MKYQELQKFLKIAKTQGMTTIRLNSKKIELEKEYARIQAIVNPAPESEPTPPVFSRREALMKIVEHLSEQEIDVLWEKVVGSNPAPAIAEQETPATEPETATEPALEAEPELLDAIVNPAPDYDTWHEIGREILNRPEFGSEHQIGIRIMAYCEILASQDAGRIERELRSEDLLDQHRIPLANMNEYYGYDISAAIVEPLCLAFIEFANKHNPKALKKEKFQGWGLNWMIKDGKAGNFTPVQAAVAAACK